MKTIEQELIELVTNNLETVKRNKIKFEIDLIHSCYDGSMSKNGILYELEHMFDKCITVEDVINEIDFKDFGGDRCCDEDLLENIKSLIEHYN
jgi:hypothetical protein